MPMEFIKYHNIQQINTTMRTIFIKHSNCSRKQHLPISTLLHQKTTYYRNIINENYTLEQNRDTRYIPLPLIVSLVHISTNKFSPQNDIRVITYTIQIQNDVALIYKEIGKHLIPFLLIDSSGFGNNTHKH